MKLKLRVVSFTLRPCLSSVLYAECSITPETTHGSKQKIITSARNVIHTVESLHWLNYYTTQPPIQGVPGALLVGVKLNTHLHLVPRSRACGAMSPFRNTPSWCGAQLKHRNFTLPYGKHATKLVWHVCYRHIINLK